MKTFSFKNAALSACLGALMSVAPALAVQLDLNEFFASGSVVRTADGSMATLFEDPGFSAVILELDPGLGDPNLIIPEVGSFLRFEFDFVEPDSDNNDMFVVYLLDASTGLSLGGMFQFTATQTEAGNLEFNLSSLAGEIIGLHFALLSEFDDVGLDSVLKITNVRVEGIVDPGEPSSIPEGGTTTLFVSGLAAIGLHRRWMRS